MRQRTTVLHVGKYYPPYMGGIETHLKALCGELSRYLDIRVLVASGDSEPAEEEAEGIAVSRVATPFSIASAPICPAFVSRLRASRADIVHVHLPNPAAALAYLASGRRGPLAVTYHSDTVKQKILGTLFEPFLHRFLHQANCIIATSPNYLASSPVLSRHRDRCTVIPYGIALDAFWERNESHVAALRREFGPRLLIAVGRLVYYKGFEYLVKAMPAIQGRLLLVGDGPLAPRLKALAERLRVADRITFLGGMQNEEIVPYYHAADVFVLPSIARSEAFGIVQIEAMAAGKPVVNTDLESGVPYVSQHGVTGVTVPPKDPVALAAAANLLLDDADLRERYGQAGRLRARAEFSLEQMAALTRDAYAGVLGKPKETDQAQNAFMARAK